ncbi:MAG: aminotransferase class V-fold PLP-dependent enzyme [Kangiellaceae bacterium]|jgi:cysteine desulfurase/selenocysteine lyase|nr:aminotransferase class V-fold PLP-dependent enzyme [Kangiellaceae bacterium]
MTQAKMANSINQSSTFNVSAVRADFPIFAEKTGQPVLHYLDSAATNQKPQSVIDAIIDVFSRYNAPVHRGLYRNSALATEAYHAARANVAQFINATSDEIIFTASTTASLNTIAQGFYANKLKPGDKVWVTRLEHHANYLPWQKVCEATGAELCMIELDDNYQLDLDRYPDLFSNETKVIATTMVSNVLGVMVPVADICQRAREFNIAVVVDAAQAALTKSIDVQSIDCDFLVFSGHKVFGPDGIGVLYAKRQHIEAMDPWLVGGGMVDFINKHFLDTQWSEGVNKFEAGSPNLSGAVGLSAAIDYIQSFNQDDMVSHVKAVSEYAYQRLSEFSQITLLTPANASQSGIVCFNHNVIHAHDIAQLTADNNVAIRAGHHCAQPLLDSLNCFSTLRASFSIYNSTDNVDALIDALDQAEELFL